MDLDFAAARLRSTLVESGCAICRLARDAEWRWAWGYLYEGVLDPELMARVETAFGFCPEHTLVLVRVSDEAHRSAPGRAIVLRHVVARISQALSGLRRRPQRAADLLAAPRPCLGCRALAHSEAANLYWLGSAPTQPRFAAAYQRSDGLCLPHLARALPWCDPPLALPPPPPCTLCRSEEECSAALLEAERLAGSADLCLRHLRHALLQTSDHQIRASLAARHRGRLEALTERLDRFIRSHDYLHRDDPLGDAARSWLDAVAFLAGGAAALARQTRAPAGTQG